MGVCSIGGIHFSGQQIRGGLYGRFGKPSKRDNRKGMGHGGLNGGHQKLTSPSGIFWTSWRDSLQIQLLFDWGRATAATCYGVWHPMPQGLSPVTTPKLVGGQLGVGWASVGVGGGGWRAFGDPTDSRRTPTGTQLTPTDLTDSQPTASTLCPQGAESIRGLVLPWSLGVGPGSRAQPVDPAHIRARIPHTQPHTQLNSSRRRLPSTDNQSTPSGK